MTSIRFKWNVFQRDWLPIEWFHFRYFNFEDINDNLKDKAFKGGQFNSCIIEMVEIRLNFVLIINNLKMIITWTTLFRNWRHFGVITSDTEIKMVYITKHSRVKWLEKSYTFSFLSICFIQFYRNREDFYLNLRETGPHIQFNQLLNWH